MTLIVMALAIGAITPKKAPQKNIHIETSARRINMTGPSPVSLAGGPYTYNVNLSNFGCTFYDGAVWSLIKNNVLVAQRPAQDPVNGVASLTLYGSDFGSTGSFTLYLVATTPTGEGLIYGSKGITVTQ